MKNAIISLKWSCFKYILKHRPSNVKTPGSGPQMPLQWDRMSFLACWSKEAHPGMFRASAEELEITSTYTALGQVIWERNDGE